MAVTPAPTTRPDLAWVSWLRVICIAGVVSIHTVGATAAASVGKPTKVATAAVLLDIGVIFVVPAFVMLSGAVLLDPQRYKGPADFLRRRAVRLLPAIVVWHLAYWAFRHFALGIPVSWRDFLTLTLTGRLSPQLYFWWIVLGLALLTPILIPWLATASRRSVIIVGAAACAMPVLTISTRLAIGASPIWVETPWTWWLFYLGLYLLGWGLRDVVLHGWVLLTVCLALVGLGLLLAWQWRNPWAPQWLQTVGPVSYYGLTVQLYAVGVFVAARSLIRPGGVAGFLSNPGAAKLGRLLGDATMGVFAIHLMFEFLVRQLPVIGGNPVATSTWQLLGRTALVFAISYVVVLLLRRVPVVRRIL